MHRFAFPMPNSPEDDSRELAAALETPRRLGVRLARIYAGPATTVAYLEADREYAAMLRAVAKSATPAVRGRLEALAAGATPELIGEWLDPAVTKRRPGLAFAFGLRPGVEARLRELADDAFRHRRYEHTLSRRALPLTVERLFLAAGSAVFYAEGDDPAGAYLHLALSRSVHDVWFKERCRELFAGEVGLALPAITTLLDYDAAAVPA